MNAGRMTVVHKADTEFGLDIRGHRLVIDQPLDAGGGDAGPTPTELFVGSIAGCVAHYAAGYMRRHHIGGPLQVTASFSIAGSPVRVDAIHLRVHAPAVPRDQLPKLSAVVHRCTLHNTLEHGVDVDILLDGEPLDDVAAIAS